jgi:hypothetical protein
VRRAGGGCAVIAACSAQWMSWMKGWRFVAPIRARRAPAHRRSAANGLDARRLCLPSVARFAKQGLLDRHAQRLRASRRGEAILRKLATGSMHERITREFP